MRKKTIPITCTGSDSLPFDRLEEFQGNLKKRGKKEIDKIIKSINKHGFSFPFFVWNGTGHNYVLDGHGRISALSEMRQKGYDLPLFPVVYIDAENEAEAKQKLLQANSHYGTITPEGFEEFIEDVEIEIEDYELEIKDYVVPSGFGDPQEAKYNDKIELVIECKNETQAEELYTEFKERGLKCKISTL